MFIIQNMEYMFSPRTRKGLERKFFSIKFLLSQPLFAFIAPLCVLSASRSVRLTLQNWSLFTLVSCYRRTMADDVFILTTIFTFWHFNIMTESAKRWKFSGRKQGGRNMKIPPRLLLSSSFRRQRSKKIWKMFLMFTCCCLPIALNCSLYLGTLLPHFSFFFRAMSGEEIFR